MNRSSYEEAILAMFLKKDYADEYLFYAHILNKFSIKLSSDIESPAGITFQNPNFILYINPELFSTYTLENRMAILKHEVLHAIFNHFLRKDNRDHKTWNIATDCAINQMINENHLPNDCILPKTLSKLLNKKIPKNENAEFYYDLLINQNVDMQTIDSHDVWDESENFGQSENSKYIIKEITNKALSETIKQIGRIPKEISKILEIINKKQEINWKKVLKNVISNKRINTKRTIYRKDRRFNNRDDLKGKIKDKLFNLLVILDVSGSMSDEEIQTTLSEIMNICRDIDVTLIQVDSEAKEPEKITKNTKVFSRKGNGGTYISTGLEKAKERKIQYDALIVITDGYINKSDLEKFEELKKTIIFLIPKTGYRIQTTKSNIKVFKLQ